MSDDPYLAYARYHRDKARAAAEAQCNVNVGTGEFIQLRAKEIKHRSATIRADKTYARETNQSVSWGKDGNPIFRPK